MKHKQFSMLLSIWSTVTSSRFLWIYQCLPNPEHPITLMEVWRAAKWVPYNRRPKQIHLSVSFDCFTWRVGLKAARILYHNSTDNQKTRRWTVNCGNCHQTGLTRHGHPWVTAFLRERWLLCFQVQPSMACEHCLPWLCVRSHVCIIIWYGIMQMQGDHVDIHEFRPSLLYVLQIL